jgi:hypothetical protein
MKSTRWTICLGVMVVAAAYFVAPLSATATADSQVTIVMNGTLTSPDSVTGTWMVSGAISDHGSYIERFGFEGSTILGVKTLTGAHGTITLRVKAEVVATSPTTIAFAHGQWRIVSGTGSYAGLVGGGSPATDPGSADLATGAVSVTHRGAVRFH